MPNRSLAAQLYQRGLSLKVIENALVLAATRRLILGRPKHRLWARFARPISYLSSRKCWHRTSARSTSNISGTSSHAPRYLGERASGADEWKTTPHACGVDDTACPSSLTNEHAFGVDDAPCLFSKSCSRPGSLQPSPNGSLLPSTEGLSVLVGWLPVGWRGRCG